MVLLLPRNSSSSSFFSIFFLTVSHIQTTIGIIFNFMFHSYFSSLVKFWYLSIFSFYFIFSLWSARTVKSTRQQLHFFLLTNTWSCLPGVINWSVFISKSLWIIMIFIIIIISLKRWLVVFPWSPSNSKFSRILLSILVNFNTAVICMVSILPLISISFGLFTKPLGTVPSTSTINSITVILMFHSFFSSLARSKNLSVFLLSFIFIRWSAGNAKSTRRDSVSL